MALPALTPPPPAPSRSDAPATFITRADDMIAWFGVFVPQMVALGDAIVAQAASSNYGSSTSSVAIGTGSKSFTIEAGKGFQVGQFVIVASTASPANFMNGQITAYNSGTGALTVNVGSVGGSGTFASWTISLAPPSGGVQKTGDTMAGPLITAASIAGAAGLNVPHGTAPTAPNNGDLWTTSSALFFRIGGVTRQAATLDGNETLTNKSLTAPAFTGATTGEALTLTGLLTTKASAAGGAGLNLPHGAAPTAPANGDMWSTTLGLFVRVNGATRQAATLDGAETLTNKTLTSPTANAPTINDAVVGSTIKDEAGTTRKVGFRGVPPRAAGSAQVLAIADNGTEIEITTGGVTVPRNADVALPSDFVCVIFNNSASPQTITQGTDVTLRLVGSTSTGSRTLAPYGMCTIRASATVNLFKISGVGVS